MPSGLLQTEHGVGSTLDFTLSGKAAPLAPGKGSLQILKVALDFCKVCGAIMLMCNSSNLCT